MVFGVGWFLFASATDGRLDRTTTMGNRAAHRTGRGVLTFWLAFGGASTPSLAAAACEDAPDVVYVDADGPVCPGDGSSATPFCLLKDAIDAAVPGRVIRVREAADLYPFTTTGSTGVSGTATAPIVIEPDCGHAPVFGGALVLIDVSHWTVRGLTFGGTSGAGLSGRADAVGTEGLRLLNNVMIGDPSAPGGGITLNRETGSEAIHVDPEIAGNVITGVAGRALDVRWTSGARIESNVVTGLRCGAANNLETHPQMGLELAQSAAARVAYNRFEDFVPSCPPGASARIAGIRPRGGSGVIERNLISGLPAHAAGPFVGGISVIDDAQDWTVRRNLVIDPGECGLCDAAEFGASVGARWLNNTVIASPGMPAIRIANNAAATVVHNNLFIGAGGEVAVVGTQAEIAVWSHNLYWSSDATPRFTFGSDAGLSFPEWRDACGCDDASLVDDPLWPTDEDDATPGAPGPAIDAGLLVGEPHAGAAPDLGALEAPAPTGVSVDPVEPPRIRIGFGAVPFGPLRIASCHGLSVHTDDDVELPLASCTVEMAADQTTSLVLELSRPIFEDTSASVRYERGGLVDSLAIGGRVGAYVQPFELAIDLTAGSEPDDVRFPDPELGCACRPNTSRSPRLLWLAMLGACIGRPRRARATHVTACRVSTAGSDPSRAGHD
jgi:hypothetical protein